MSAATTDTHTSGQTRSPPHSSSVWLIAQPSITSFRIGKWYRLYRVDVARRGTVRDTRPTLGLSRAR
jgi:hypothetical protein